MKTTRISIRLDRRVASAAAAGPFPARCPQPAPQNPPRARPAPHAGTAPSSPAKHAPARHTRVRDPRHTRVRDRPRTAGHVQCAATCRATDPPPLASIPHQRPVSAKAPAAACVHPSRACRVQGAAGPFLALGVRSQRSRACRAQGGACRPGGASAGPMWPARMPIRRRRRIGCRWRARRPARPRRPRRTQSR